MYVCLSVCLCGLVDVTLSVCLSVYIFQQQTAAVVPVSSVHSREFSYLSVCLSVCLCGLVDVTPVCGLSVYILAADSGGGSSGIMNSF